MLRIATGDSRPMLAHMLVCCGKCDTRFVIEVTPQATVFHVLSIVVLLAAGYAGCSVGQRLSTTLWSVVMTPGLLGMVLAYAGLVALRMITLACLRSNVLSSPLFRYDLQSFHFSLLAPEQRMLIRDWEAAEIKRTTGTHQHPN